MRRIPPAPGAALLIALAAACAVAAEEPPLPGLTPAPVPLRVFRADDKAPATPAKLQGAWAGSITAPDGTTRREIALRFVDAHHLVWTTTQVSPGVRASGTNRFRYEFKGDELLLEGLERYAGSEKLPPFREADKKREYTVQWVTEGGKPGLRLVAKGAEGSPWAAVTLRPGDQPAAGSPLDSPDLQGLDRTIRKEPKYESAAPLYALLVFGKAAGFKVWVVLDGAVLYVDRNGDGDLTGPGERFALGGVPGVEPNVRTPTFLVEDLTDPATKVKHTQFFLSALRTNTGGVFAKMHVHVGGRTVQMAGLTQLAESPREARVLHFDAPNLTVVPSQSLPTHLEVGTKADFRVQVGAFGLGAASFAAYGSDQAPDGAAPTAEFEFPPAKAGGEVKKVAVKLTQKCCGDQFFAEVAVPEGAKVGVETAKVTLAFPDSPWGPAKPRTYLIDVLRKQKD